MYVIFKGHPTGEIYQQKQNITGGYKLKPKVAFILLYLFLSTIDLSIKSLHQTRRGAK
jgi:hypothetical protein